MNNVLLVICGMLIAAFAALFAVPHFVDWNSYRSVFEEEATRVLGREVRVSGAVNLRLLPSPYVEFERIRIADSAGEGAEPLFRADRFTMWLAVPPLLRGVLEAKEVTLKRPVLRLAVDGEGRGNWRTLALNPSDLPFIPAGVALQSVKITKGSILLARQGGDALARVDSITGELSAEALDGPYKFNGSGKWGDSEREVRLATAKADPDGTIRFKASVRGGAAGGEYALDGALSDLAGQPRLAGEITAKIPIATDRLAFAPKGKVLAERPAFDLKAKIEGNGTEVALADITLSFDNVGQPQLITGQAKALWRDAPRLDVTLASRWLDLDSIAGTPEGASPLEVARVLLAALLGAMPGDARTSTTFSVDQAALGGEAVSGFSASLVRAEGPLRLERLTAGMPGGSRIDVEGELSPHEDEPAFKGRVALHGTNLGRFLAWASRLGSSAEAGGGTFALRGQLDATQTGVEVTNAVAELAGMPLAGDVRYRAKDRRSLEVKLEGRTIDLGQLWPGLTLESAGQWLFSGGTGAEGPSSRPETLKLDLKFAELVSGERRLRDLDATVALEAGRLTLRSLSFKTADALTFGLDGAVEGVGKDAHGALKWTLEAPTSDSVAAFAAFAGENPLAATLFNRAASLAPLRVAGSMTLGQRAASSADIVVDGMAKGGRLTASLRLDGGLAGWREATAEASVTLATPDIDALTRDFAGSSRAGVQQGPPPPSRAGHVLLAATGVPAEGLATTFSVDADGLAASFDGNFSLPAQGETGDLNGQLTVDAKSVGDVFALAGLTLAPAARRFPVSGRIDIARTDGGVGLEPVGLTIGGSSLSGRVTASAGESGGHRLDADLKASDAALRSLFSVVLAGAPPPSEELGPAKPNAWPSELFDFSGLDGVEGRVRVDFGKLDVGAGLALADAKLEAELSPRKIAITKLDGAALGGSFGSAATLTREAAGVRLKGALSLAGADLAAFARAGGRAASGAASLELAFTGQALSPSALVAALTGSGKIDLKTARLAGLTAAGVGTATDAALLGKAPAKGEGLVKALRAGLAQGDLPLGSREIPVEILDGAARVKSFDIETEKGRTTAEITVDLATFDVDSEWRIALNSPPRTPPRPPFPPVSVVYVGPLANVADLEPRVAADAFERELAVRRLESDVDELERLRKGDEERTRAEAERQKALDAARAPTGATGPAPETQSESGWAPSTAPATDAGAPASTSDAGAPPPATAPPASAETPSETPRSRQGASNAAPPRRKPPPAFNPWNQLGTAVPN